MFCIIFLHQSLFNAILSMLEPLQSAMVKCIFSLDFITEEEKSLSGMHAPFSLNEAISVQICVPVGFYQSLYHEVIVKSNWQQDQKKVLHFYYFDMSQSVVTAFLLRYCKNANMMWHTCIDHPQKMREILVFLFTPVETPKFCQLI